MFVYCFLPLLDALCALLSALCSLRYAHSYRRLSTGFAVAALTACEPTVNKAMTNANKPVTANIHRLEINPVSKTLQPFVQDIKGNRPGDEIGHKNPH